MNIRIQVRHDAATERIQKYITTEFERLRLAYEVISADFIVDCEGPSGHVKIFESIVHVQGDTFAVKETADEVHKAVDTAMKVIEKLLKRHKETYLRPGSLIRHNAERRQPNV
jgi:ribosomal subunit interface protein